MALAMSHHSAYTERSTSRNHSDNHYPGDGGEPGPAPTLLELLERVVEGRIDSDPQVGYGELCGFSGNHLLGVVLSDTCMYEGVGCAVRCPRYPPLLLCRLPFSATMLLYDVMSCPAAG